MVVIEYEGGSYPFDFDDIGVKQGIAIEAHTGMPFAEWATAIGRAGNLLARQALGWVILTGGDLDAPIADCDFKMGKLNAALEKAFSTETEAEARKAAEQPPDPTPGAAAATSASRPENGAGTTGALLPASSGPA
jgi:hypothetical protein